MIEYPTEGKCFRSYFTALFGPLWQYVISGLLISISGLQKD